MLRKRLEQLAQRDRKVTEVFADWVDIKNSPSFLAWIAMQAENQVIVDNSPNSMDVVQIVEKYKKEQNIQLKEVGKVTSILKQYDYLTFSLTSGSCLDLKKIYVQANGLKLMGKVEKCLGSDASATFKKDDLLQIQINDYVYSAQ